MKNGFGIGANKVGGPRDLGNEEAPRAMSHLNFLFNALGLGCWGICFFWMHRISRHQDTMLEELHAVTRRIERLSKAEHDLIKEVHPKIDKLSEHVEEVAEEARAAKG